MRLKTEVKSDINTGLKALQDLSGLGVDSELSAIVSSKFCSNLWDQTDVKRQRLMITGYLSAATSMRLRQRRYVGMEQIRLLVPILKS
jgi:hypothetical protein